jgi:hypothetical protein
MLHLLFPGLARLSYVKRATSNPEDIGATKYFAGTCLAGESAGSAFSTINGGPRGSARFSAVVVLSRTALVFRNVLVQRAAGFLESRSCAFGGFVDCLEVL